MHNDIQAVYHYEFLPRDSSLPHTDSEHLYFLLKDINLYNQAFWLLFLLYPYPKRNSLLVVSQLGKPIEYCLDLNPVAFQHWSAVILGPKVCPCRFVRSSAVHNVMSHLHREVNRLPLDN